MAGFWQIIASAIASLDTCGAGSAPYATTGSNAALILQWGGLSICGSEIKKRRHLINRNDYHFRSGDFWHATPVYYALQRRCGFDAELAPQGPAYSTHLLQTQDKYKTMPQHSGSLPTAYLYRRYIAAKGDNQNAARGEVCRQYVDAGVQVRG